MYLTDSPAQHLARIYKDCTRDYPFNYSPGRFADMARQLAAARRHAARVAALPQWARDALADLEGEIYRDSAAVTLPGGARLVAKIEPDDVNAVADLCTVTRASRSEYEHAAEGWMPRNEHDEKPRALWTGSGSRFDWQWISDDQGMTVREWSDHFREQGASTGRAWEMARAATLRHLDYLRRYLDDGAPSGRYSVTLDGEVIDSLGGCDDANYCADEMWFAVLDALESHAEQLQQRKQAASAALAILRAKRAELRTVANLPPSICATLRDAIRASHQQARDLVAELRTVSAV